MHVSEITKVTTWERKEEGQRSSFVQPFASKSLRFVLERMSHEKGGLFPSATAPQIVIDFVSEKKRRLRYRYRKNREK